MKTSNSSSSSPGGVGAAPICVWKEDAPATGPVLAEEPLVAVAPTAESVSRTGTPPSCAAPAAESWGPSSLDVSRALDP
jgi:hypothetical protein